MQKLSKYSRRLKRASSWLLKSGMILWHCGGGLVLAQPTASFKPIADGQHAGTLCINQVTILTADPLQPNQVRRQQGSVLISDGKIVRVSRDALTDFRQCQVLDGQGKYLIPGLIDSHIHPYRVPGFHAGHYRKFPDWVEAWRRAEPKLYLWHGFTTLLDAGDWQATLAERYYRTDTSPTLYGVGATVRQLDGYGHNFFPKSTAYQQLPNWLFNPSQQLPAGAVASQHQPAAAVQQVVDQHGIAVKTFAEDGFSGAIPDLVLPEPALLQQVVNQAHQANLPVMLHATSLTGYQRGVAAGVDIFAHGLWHFAYADFWRIEPPAAVQQLLAQFPRHIHVQPTLRVVLAEQEALNSAIRLPAVLSKTLPADLLQWYQSPAGQWGRDDQLEFTAAIKQRLPLPAEALAASAEQLTERMSARARAMLKLMNQQQVQLIFGTDTPTPDNRAVAIAGANGLAEMQAWAEAGVSLTDIFLAATARNAKAFRLPAGEIQPGKVADLLLLDADPLQDIQAYQHIHRWIVRGKLLNAKDILTSNHASAQPNPTQLKTAPQEQL